MTVTISSLAEDMLDSYLSNNHLHDFSWSNDDLLVAITDFIHSRDCFFYTENRAPVLEAEFRVTHLSDPLEIAIHFTLNPPVVQFESLRNVLSEGDQCRLKPLADLRGFLPTTAEYFIGPGEGWLEWDESYEGFRGPVPGYVAGSVGAERLDSYTVPLELTTRVTKHFPGAIRLERVFRCSVPLTVKRQPSTCASQKRQTHSPLVKAPLLGVSSRTNAPSYVQRPTRAKVIRGDNKENDFQTDFKRLERKVQDLLARPLRLDSLSYAQLHEAIALAHPRVTDVEVRTVLVSPRGQNAPPVTPQQPRSVKSAKDSTEDNNEISLGSTRMDRRGRLLSRSGSRHDSVLGSTPARNITPPSQKSEKSSVTCYTCRRCRRRPNIVEKDGTRICLTCRAHERLDRLIACRAKAFEISDRDLKEAAKPSERGNSIDEWQKEIQESYKEFEANKDQKQDTTMEDVFDESDQELPSFHSDS